MKRINYQFLISYFGLIPFIFIFVDSFFLNFFSIKLLKDFLILYSLTILTFIGAIRWSFEKKQNLVTILFGFLPSAISTFLIFIYLLEYNTNKIILSIIFFLIFQLFIDFFYINNKSEQIFYLYVRLPLVFLISLILIYFISV